MVSGSARGSFASLRMTVPLGAPWGRGAASRPSTPPPPKKGTVIPSPAARRGEEPLNPTSFVPSALPLQLLFHGTLLHLLKISYICIGFIKKNV